MILLRNLLKELLNMAKKRHFMLHSSFSSHKINIQIFKILYLQILTIIYLFRFQLIDKIIKLQAKIFRNYTIGLLGNNFIGIRVMMLFNGKNRLNGVAKFVFYCCFVFSTIQLVSGTPSDVDFTSDEAKALEDFIHEVLRSSKQFASMNFDMKQNWHFKHFQTHLELTELKEGRNFLVLFRKSRNTDGDLHV